MTKFKSFMRECNWDALKNAYFYIHLSYISKGKKEEVVSVAQRSLNDLNREIQLFSIFQLLRDKYPFIRDLTFPSGINMPQTLQGIFLGQPTTMILSAPIKAFPGTQPAPSSEVTLLHQGEPFTLLYVVFPWSLIPAHFPPWKSNSNSVFLLVSALSFPVGKQ